jgi:hypothetical protein
VVKIFNKVSTLGIAAALFLVAWTLIFSTWLVWAIVVGIADLSVTDGTIITAVLLLPYKFVSIIDDFFPRKGDDVNSTTNSSS